MKSKEFIADAVRWKNYPDDKYSQDFVNSELYDAEKLSDVSSSLSIWKKNKYLALKKDEKILIGFVKVSDENILGKAYNHIDLIYVLLEFRKTSAVKWLLFAIKEYAGLPVIADGAIFTGGENLIMSLGKYGMAEPKVFNKITGEKSTLIEPINDPDLCYLFESTRLGPGKNYFAEDPLTRGKGWIWYASALFEDI